MNISDVIQAGDFTIVERYLNILESGDLVLFKIVLILYVSFLVYILFMNIGMLIRVKYILRKEFSNYIRLKPEKTIDLLFPTLVFCFWVYSISFLFVIDQDGRTTQNWVRNHVSPYVESLPVETVKLEAVDRVEHAPTYITNKNEAKDYVPVSVIYANEEGEGVTLKTKTLIMYDAEDESPYMEYKGVEKDLGHGYDKGFYNTVIHLPLGYYFNQ